MPFCPNTSFWERLVNRLQALGLAGGLIVISVVTIFHNRMGGYVRNDGLYGKAQFMRMVREAFPEYSDLSDSDLLTRFLTTYPTFKTWIREETNGSPRYPTLHHGIEFNIHRH